MPGSWRSRRRPGPCGCAAPPVPRRLAGIECRSSPARARCSGMRGSRAADELAKPAVADHERLAAFGAGAIEDLRFGFDLRHVLGRMRTCSVKGR